MKKKRWKKVVCMSVLVVLIVLLPVMSQAGTWKRNSTGWWWQEDDGSWPANQWKYIRGTWYAFDGNGYMRTGWYWDGRSWYYLTGSGAMAEGWKKIGGTWYYLQPGNGAMQTGWVKDGNTWYYMNGSGAMLTGWQQINGAWYYLYSNGKMAENTWIGSYYVNQSGAWIPGAVQSQWICSGDRWWYRHSDGSYTVNGWETINQKKYHFDKDGWMQTGWQKIGGNWYYLGPVGDGAMRSSQWVDDSYLGSDGKMMTACWVDNYYVGTSGKIAKNQWVQDYYVGSDGKKLKNQWIGDYYVGQDGKKVTSQWIGDSYVGEDGVLARNQWIGDSYVDTDGLKVRNTWVGDRYLDANGKWDRTKPVRVPLTGIKVSTTGRLLKPGKTSEIGLWYYPENTTDDLTATWTSSDESVATVADGVVTAHKAGYVMITVSVSGVSEKIDYMVVPADPSGLTMKIVSNTWGASDIRFGESATASVFLQPGNFDITSYATLSVDDENILKTNDGVGSLWSVGIGETTVRATYEDMEVSSKVKVICEEGELQELYFDKKTLYLGKNQTGSLKLSSKPEVYANSKGVKWGSTDESVVAWDPIYGLLAKKPGKAIVYAEIMGKRAECEVIVSGEEDVIEYSEDMKYAKNIFDEINKLRVSNGVEPFVWNEADALYASKIRAGMYVKNEENDVICPEKVAFCMENEITQDVQIAYRVKQNYVEEYVLDALLQDSSCLVELMKKTDQPLTAGCTVAVKTVDGKLTDRVLVFTIGPSEGELAKYSQQEREEYWANWMGISAEEAKKYLY